MTTLADLVYIDDTGYHFSDYPTFLTWLQDSYRAIYGADVYLEADSQDGQWIAIQARALYDTAALGASVYNSFSPVTAQGTGLSRNVKINGIERIDPTHSTVDLLIVGVGGTSLIDAVAYDTLNQKWLIPSPTTIPGGGSITVTAIAEEVGDIEAAANTVTGIFTPTLGWQSVNNPSAATAGVPVESDAELRARQQISTANPSLTVLDGTRGAVANVSGVIYSEIYENDTDATDGNGIPSHSIAPVVQGGDSTDIAEAIALHKTPGTGTFGTTTVNVTDSKGMPLAIEFSRPTTYTVKVEITIAATADYVSAYGDLIKEAVAAQINVFGIGKDTLITKLYAPAYLNGTAPGQTYDVALLEIGKNAAPVAGINIPTDWDELPQCDPDTDVTIIVT